MSAQYLKLVDKAKFLLTKKEMIKMEIAQMALEVCTIKHGGISKGFYTLQDFAKDIGIDRKKLSDWTLTYKMIVAKIPDFIKTESDWAKAHKISLSLSRSRAIQNKQSASVGTRGLLKKDLERSAEEILVLFTENNDNVQRLSYAQEASSRCLFNLKQIESLRDTDIKFIYNINDDLNKVIDIANQCLDITLKLVDDRSKL